MLSSVRFPGSAEPAPGLPCCSLSTRRLNLGIHFGFHVMTLVERFDAEVGKEADNQQFGHDVPDGVVGLRLRHPGEDTVI